MFIEKKNLIRYLLSNILLLHDSKIADFFMSITECSNLTEFNNIKKKVFLYISFVYGIENVDYYDFLKNDRKMKIEKIIN
jgi:hypothetical protein